MSTSKAEQARLPDPMDPGFLAAAESLLQDAARDAKAAHWRRGEYVVVADAAGQPLRLHRAPVARSALMQSVRRMRRLHGRRAARHAVMAPGATLAMMARPPGTSAP